MQLKRLERGSDGSELTREASEPSPPSASLWRQLDQSLYGEFQEQFGGAVTLSSNGNIMAVGGCFDDAGGYRSTYVLVYSFDRATSRWSQLGQRLEGEEADDGFGSAVALSL